MMSAVVVALALTAVAPTAGACPSACEVDELLGSAATLGSEKRFRRATSLVRRLMRCHKADDGDPILLWEYFLERWAEVYRGVRDPMVIRVVDEAPVDGGYHLALCGFYANIEFPAGSRLNDFQRGVFSQCTRPAKFASRSPQTPTVAAPPASDQREHQISACDTKRLLGKMRSLKPRPKRVVVEAALARTVAAETHDEAGVTFFYSSLRARLSESPDEATFGAIDAVASRSQTTALCRLLIGAGDSTIYAKHYSQPEAKALLLACIKTTNTDTGRWGESSLGPAGSTAAVSVLHVSADGRALEVRRSTDAAVQTVDVLGKCGAPAIGEPRIRNFGRSGETIGVTFGKHCAAEVSLADLSVVCKGCD